MHCPWLDEVVALHPREELKAELQAELMPPYLPGPAHRAALRLREKHVASQYRAGRNDASTFRPNVRRNVRGTAIVTSTLAWMPGYVQASQ
jgi:hypothetical protein